MKSITTLAAMLLACLTTQAQSKKFERSVDIGLLAGSSYYMGEVNPYKHFGTRLRPGGGIAYRNSWDRRWSVRGSLLYHTIEAWDEDSNDPWIRNRNLHFKNQVIEGSLQFELNFFPYQLGNRGYKMSPYLFAGVGYFNMKPMANFKGTWYELQPLGTEGQGTQYGGDKYKTGLMSVPFGVGFKMNLYAIFGLSVEWGMRKTWTDHFDDISGVYINPELLEDESGLLTASLSDNSIEREIADPDGNHNGGLQRGDPGRKDFYNFFMLSLNIRIDKKATTCWK
ncbi:MAG: DUF6089 family protein [Flavobacteriales bacterium]